MLESTQPTRERRTKTRSAATSASPSTAAAATTADLHGRIERRAYDLYERRGCVSGHELEDWLEAERQVREEAPE
jgi:hypothetical protein